MAGANIRIDINEGEVLRVLGEIARRAADLTQPFQDIGAALVNSTKDRFTDQKAPDGTPWEALSPAYQARKKQNKDLILVLGGYLHDTIRYQASAEDLRVGSDREYAATMQYGAKQGAFGKTKRGAPIPWGDIPARPFLGLSDDDQAMVLEVLRDYLLEG